MDFALSLALASLLQAQSAGQASVTLGSDVTMVGQEARIAITLDPAGEAVTAVDDDVVFPAVLSFVGAEPGETGKALSAKVEATLAEAPAAAQERTVHVTVRAPEGARLSAGTLAVVKLKAPESIDGENTDLRLSHRPAVVVDGKRREIASPDGSGVVTVLKKPLDVIACFFYMH